MKYFFIVGEVSGDLLASKVVEKLSEMDIDAQFYGSGGERMRREGVELTVDIKQMAFMGLAEVLKNIFRVWRNFRVLKKSILEINPDVIVLVDYPGFNLRMAKWAKSKGFKVAYYVAPKVWAWKENRVRRIKKYVDVLMVILPFEKEFFEKHEVSTVYVGHPLLELIPPPKEGHVKDKIALLPGSRKQEIERMLPVMLKAMYLEGSVDKLVVAGLSEFGTEYYEKIIEGRAELVMDQVYEILDESKLAIVASGTASLEAALKMVPQVVCYAVHPFTYWIAKLLVKVNYISLVNLIMKSPVVPEVIQGKLQPKFLKDTSMLVLQDEVLILNEYLSLRNLLGDADTSKKVAHTLHEFSQKKGD